MGGIPFDIEDELLLLRLFKFGDLSFVRQAIIPPSGYAIVQLPYRAINDLNSYSRLRFEFETEECEAWRSFADQIRRGPSWRSTWFSTARRFFLSGGAKELNPQWGDVDRIADYATALEATLVPESDFNTRRLSNRAGALLAGAGLGEQPIVSRLIKKIYDIRSGIVHGSPLADETGSWLLDHWREIEIGIRHILVSAVSQLPAGEGDRRKALSSLYDPTDEDRGELCFQKFTEIKSRTLRQRTGAKIAEVAGK